MRPNGLELSGTWSLKAEDLLSLRPNRPSGWSLDTPGAWGISGPGLFNLVWTEPGRRLHSAWTRGRSRNFKFVVIFLSAASVQKFKRVVSVSSVDIHRQHTP